MGTAADFRKRTARSIQISTVSGHMSEEINSDRRNFLGKAMMTIAAARLRTSEISASGIGETSARKASSGSSPAQVSFTSVKQIDAGVLNVGYAEVGPTTGPAVVLLHGWPYDIHSYVDVAPLLTSAGYRVIVPYLRGYGTTRFLSSETFRNGQPSVIALDIIALMDVL